MKKHIYQIVLLFAMLYTSFTVAMSQNGSFAELNYKIGSTGMSYAYASLLPLSDADPTLAFALHKDGFWQHNFQLYIGTSTENTYARCKLDGLIYGIATLFIGSGKTGPLKSKFRKYSKLVEEYPTLASREPDWNISSVHPEGGAGDYKYIDLDFAFGRENFKFGLNYGLGFIGANGNSNGLGVGTGTLHAWGAASYNIGYQQYGIKAHHFNQEKYPYQLSLGLHRVTTIHQKRFQKRTGWGMDFEGKIFLRESGLSPYIGCFYEFKRFSKSKNFTNGSLYTENSLPALRTNSVGITLGIRTAQ